VATVEIREVNIGFNRMAEQLAKAEADRTLMLAGISHDLRTPLARLRLETEMSVPEETPRQLMAADIEQVTAIIDKFLDYARAEHVQLGTVCLNEVVQAALQPYAGSPDSLVRFNNDQKWQVKADGIELRRVLDNLLENESRYGRGPDHTLKLDLHATQEGQTVKLVVTDHGAGAPAELLPRLMEPFFRANEARTAATGSGLGLAIAARTMQRMGGQLTLRQAPTGGLAAELLLRTA
jgi:two-component system osmolarity sensor histidine kinase EnvZ